MKRKIILVFLTMMFSIGAFAQGGTVSPYSQYGLGEMAQRGGGLNQGLNGLGIGLHRSYLVNPLNPASYAQTDTLTMLFDVGAFPYIWASRWIHG